MTQFGGAEAAGTTPGAALAAARARVGLSVADVAGQMRISPRQVEAIEADRYGELPGAVFVRGFVRNYARLLKLDPVPLLHALEPAIGQDTPLRAHVVAGTLPVPTRRTRTVGWPAILIVLVACVLGAGLYEYWRSHSNEVVARPTAVPPSHVESAADLKARPDPGVPAPAPSEAAPASAALQNESQPLPALDVQAPVTTTLPDTTANTRLARIGIEFVRESWIELRDKSGNVVFSGTGSVDSVRAFEVQPPVAVLIGNASGVRITYNDQPFDVASHATRNIARFTLE